jgi:hypothetical protein
MIKEYSIDFNKAIMEFKAYKTDGSYPDMKIEFNPIYIIGKKSGIKRKIPIPMDDIIDSFMTHREGYDYQIFIWDLEDD